MYDLKAGFITAVVALPLAVAFAIASGVSPVMGLYTAIIAGILGSTLGGSQFSITGPTGAMTVIILSTVQKFGLPGLLLTGFFAGVFQILFGIFRLGKSVKYIPLPIISGFTAGIGVIIFIGQIKNALGVNVAAKEHIWETLWDIAKSIPLTNYLAVAITVITILMLIYLPKLFIKSKYTKIIPASIVALIFFVCVTIYVNSHFSGVHIPTVLDIQKDMKVEMMHFDFGFFGQFDWDSLKYILPAALTIALLGAIEALLCAVVADGMTNTKHNSNKELVAQGVANITLPFFGAIPATAAIARTAVNIKEGAKTRIAGIVHAIFLLGILIAAIFLPIMSYIPMAFLAGVLMYVSFRMIDVHEFKTISSISRMDTLVLWVTFILTVMTDLVLAVEIGMVLAVVLLFVRLTNIIDVSKMEDYDTYEGINVKINKSKKLKENVTVYTINGPFFFGAMNVFEGKAEEFMQSRKRIVIVRLRYVPFIDTTGVVRLTTFIKDCQKQKKTVFLTGANKAVTGKLMQDAAFKELVSKKSEKQVLMFEHTQEALDYIEKEL